MSHVIQEKLSREVLRKLRLATEAEEKEDREIICGEVFADVTGDLDALAREALGVEHSCRFYEVLAPYFYKQWDAAEALLYICRRLWGQPYIAPVYTLLLHRWLLLHKDAGGQLQRQKHVNVLISGARQLMWGDVHSAAPNFKHLYNFLAQEVVLATDRAHLATLPGPSWIGLLSVVAAFLPFYYPAEELPDALSRFPGPDQRHAGLAVEEGEGADLVVGELADTLRHMRTEASLLRYLSALLALRRSALLTHTRRITRIRLQAELYSLTSRGGPRYLPRRVNGAAFEVLDALFPAGHRSRRAVAAAFRLWFHPLEGPRSLVAAALGLARLLAQPVLAAWRRLLALWAWLQQTLQSLRDRIIAVWEKACAPWRRFKQA